MFEVRSPGLLSSIQDGGRSGYGHLGVPTGGACDPWSLAAANLLLGNDPGDAALEVTLIGPELLALETCAVAIAGADLGARIVEEDRPVDPGTGTLVWAGSTLRFEGPAAGRSDVPAGARAYVALPGGVDVPRVLGSAATDLRAGFGGLGGRTLLPGDRLAPVRTADLSGAGRRWPIEIPCPSPATPVRVVAGPDLDRVGEEILEAFMRTEWRVTPASDRMGLRLAGDSVLRTAAASAEPISKPMVWGAVQLPPEGQPIVLLADHPTVGGYPVVAVAARADWPVLGQLAPGDVVRFTPSTIADAQRRYVDQRAALRRAATMLGRRDPWEHLAESAQG